MTTLLLSYNKREYFAKLALGVLRQPVPGRDATHLGNLIMRDLQATLPYLLKAPAGQDRKRLIVDEYWLLMPRPKAYFEPRNFVGSMEDPSERGPRWPRIARNAGLHN